MNAEAQYERSPSVPDAENWLALGTGALLLIVGASRRSVMGACLAASVPLLYRGITGRWPNVLNGHLGRTLEFIKDQYRHCKPILALGESDGLLEAWGIDTTLPSGNADPGVLVGSYAASVTNDFVAAIAKHRHFARETDPPRV